MLDGELREYSELALLMRVLRTGFLITFECFDVQVIKWIDEHGEPFLQKHTDVGKTSEKADALLKRHQEFETIVQVSDFKLFFR